MKTIQIIALTAFAVSLFLALRVFFGNHVLYSGNELSGYLLICGLTAVFAFPKSKTKWQIGFIFLVAAGIMAMLPSYPVPAPISVPASRRLENDSVVVTGYKKKPAVAPQLPADVSSSRPYTRLETYTNRQREPRALPDIP